MCSQNQRLSLFPLLAHGSIGTGNEFSVNISQIISLKYLVCIGAFSPGGTPSYKLQKYQRPKGRVFAQGREGELIRISSDRDDRMGPKIKTQKNPQGFQQNPPKKSLDQKLAPKKSHAESLSLNRRTRRPGFSVGTITILQTVLNSQNNPYLNQATQKKFLPNFTTQKDLGIENFKPPEILCSSLSLEILSTPPPVFLGRFGLKTGVDFAYRIWFSREQRQYINVSIISVPND